MTLQEQYEEKFNGANAVKADESWQRYMQPAGVGCHVRERYEYSVQHLWGRVLDVGCGDGFGAYLMLQNPEVDHVTCFDVQDEALARAQQNLNGVENIMFVKGFGEEMPFTGQQFDCIHCGHTLEHVFDDKVVLNEISRVAAGFAVVSVPLHAGVNRRHVREYTKEGFLVLIRERFNILELKIFPRGGNIKSLVVILTWNN